MKHENKHTQKGNKKMTQEITSYEEYSIHTTLKSAKAMIDQLFSFTNLNIYDYETACNYSFNSDIIPTHSIAPLAGTCLLATNQNPTILHRVRPSNPKYDRLALLAVFQVELIN